MKSWLLVVVALIVGSAHAQTPAPQEATEAKPVESQPVAPAPAADPTTTPIPAPAAEPKKLGEKQVPMLSVRWDCGPCTQNDKVPPLLEVAYNTEAAAAGYTVSSDEKAEMVITEFRQRPPGARAMLGIFAGKDVLTTRVVFRGKTYAAADYMANAWVGMNGICENVGKEALQKMVLQLQAK